MDIFNFLIQNIIPNKIKCSELVDPESVLDPMNPQEDYNIVSIEKRKVPNFEHLLNSVLMITGNIDFIKGFKFDLGFSMSEYFHLSHSWLIPNSGVQQKQSFNPMMMPVSNKPTYTLTTQLVQDVHKQQPQLIMLGKVDSEGKLQTFLIKKLMKNLTMRITGSFPSSNVEHGMLSLDFQYENPNCNAIFRYGQGHWGINLMQKIHRNIILGFDYTNLHVQKMSIFSYGIKAFFKNHTLFGQYLAMHDQINLAYLIPIKKGSAFVSHYRYDARQKKSTTIIGFKQKYQQSEIMATINSRYKITTQLIFKNASYALRLCALADYSKDLYSFGYGINFGQQ